jgi:transcriptional regulator with XRE-family HTH domain
MMILPKNSPLTGVASAANFRTMGKEHMGVRLRRFRKRADMSQAKLAAAAGVPLGTFRNWESGRRKPSLDNVIRLAETLGISLDELVGYEPPPSKRRRQGAPLPPPQKQ